MYGRARIVGWQLQSRQVAGELTAPVVNLALHRFAPEQLTLPRRKIAILNLAQGVELAVKAALVENNVSIYEKGGSRTISAHDALVCLAKLWQLDRLAGHARIELLIDERNAIQHRYGSIDEVTLDYHMQTTFDALASILREEFDTDLNAWVKDTLPPEIWRQIRFVASDEPKAETPTAAIVSDRSPTVDFIDGFARFERGVREMLAPFLNEGESFTGSTLDIVIKALSNAPTPSHSLIRRVPDVYRLRNRAVHGADVPTAEQVGEALSTLDDVIAVLSSEVSSEVLNMALRATQRGHRGTRLLTRIEEAQADFDVIPEAESM